MEELYRKRGGVDTFNCVSLRLFEEDLIALREEVSNHSLPKTSGFFFGESNPGGSYEDYAFISRALSAIECGWAVYYDSWW
jgi:hypothetical protein